MSMEGQRYLELARSARSAARAELHTTVVGAPDFHK
jgi:hypothetical protein